MNKLKNYINGTWTESLSQQVIDVVNPASQEILATVPYGAETRKDIDLATESAIEAYKKLA